MSHLGPVQQDRTLLHLSREASYPRGKHSGSVAPFLFLRAYRQLMAFDHLVHDGTFSELCQRVRLYPTASNIVPGPSVETVCKAVDVAAIFYRKRLLCLQRSAATTCLLRRYGFRACMVIGSRILPCRSHAWVELDGTVVNDKPRFCYMYAILERF